MMTRGHPRVEFDAPKSVRVGLLVLSTDDGIHEDLALLTPEQAEVYTTRMPSYVKSGPGAHASDIVDAASTLVPHLELDAIGYACTSGSLVVGREAIAEALSRAHPEALCITPLEALAVAAAAAGVHRLCLVTPYPRRLTDQLATRVSSLGLEITSTCSLDIADELIARISTASVTRAAVEAARDDVEAEGIYLACNALRSAAALHDIEFATGRRVLTSTKCMLWQALAHSARNHGTVPAELGHLESLEGERGAHVYEGLTRYSRET